MSDQTADTLLGIKARLPRLFRVRRALSQARAQPREAHPEIPRESLAPPIPAAAKPGSLAWLSKQILHLSFNTAFLLFVALAIYTAWQLHQQQSAIIVEPITVPDALATEGYTSELATRNLRDEIQYLQNAANTKFGKKPCLADTQTDWNKDVNAIDLPGTGLSIRDIVDLLRSLIPGLQPREITGEFFLSNSRLVLELWLGDNNIYYGIAAAPGVDQGTITSLIDGIDPSKITPTTPPSALGAAFAIIRQTQPYIAASALDSWGDEPNAITILNDIIVNAPRTDPELPWANNLLGYIDLKAQNYPQAISYFLKAPDLAIAHSNLCYLYFDHTQPALYDPAKAQAECARAIALDPTLLKPRELLGQIDTYQAASSIDSASAQQSFEAAIQQFRAVETLVTTAPSPRLSETSDLAAAYDGLGGVYANAAFRGYDPARAQTEYVNAVNLNPASPTPLALLANFRAAQRHGPSN